MRTQGEGGGSFSLFCMQWVLLEGETRSHSQVGSSVCPPHGDQYQLGCKESRGDMLNFCSPDTLFPGGSDGNLHAAWETRVRFLGWEDPLEKGMAIHSSILAWRIPQRSLVGYSPPGHNKSDTTERLTL